MKISRGNLEGKSRGEISRGNLELKSWVEILSFCVLMWENFQKEYCKAYCKRKKGNWYHYYDNPNCHQSFAIHNSYGICIVMVTENLVIWKAVTVSWIGYSYVGCDITALEPYFLVNAIKHSPKVPFKRGQVKLIVTQSKSSDLLT